ncbi:MAG TPA: tetratricopeptide repeat protein [Steroidobacteraceae bacterium]|nr:tetratricopeptide repeat protein [Steroidobacteraceae bacterium]
MLQLPPFAWILIVAALVVGILAGHFGWGRRWTRRVGRFHADYLAGLDYLISEQPDRALDSFLKLMDANADTLETHFALGSLYRRRGETERAIRVHRNLLSRGLAPEHREQALLALAQDYLRAGLLDRAEGLFQQVSEGTRLRGRALEALRQIYERQRDWPQALDAHRQLANLGMAPPRAIEAHYLCELATYHLERGDVEEARRLLRIARREAAPFPRAAVLRAQIAEREGQADLAVRLLTWALEQAPKLLYDELAHLLRLAGEDSRERVLADLVRRAQTLDGGELKGLVYAALALWPTDAASLRAPIEEVVAREPTLLAVWQAAPHASFDQMAAQVGALLARAETYRCGDCGFSARRFYWQCPGCHSWDGFETCVVIKLR